MRKFVLFALLVLLFAACGKEEKIVYIEFAHSEGIKTKAPLLLNGVNVGTVLDIDISNDYKVITTVRLSDSLDFPKDTGFEIQSQDVFTKVIVVTLGKWEVCLKNGDTLQGITRIDPLQHLDGTSPRPKLFDEIKEMLKN